MAVDYDILKQAVCQKYDLPQNCFREAFNNRTLRKGESVIEYDRDLKHLAIKAYPDQTLQSVQPSA